MVPWCSRNVNLKICSFTKWMSDQDIPVQCLLIYLLSGQKGLFSTKGLGWKYPSFLKQERKKTIRSMFGKKDDVQVSHLGFHMQGSFVHSLCLSLTTLLPISDREESYKASREIPVKKTGIHRCLVQGLRYTFVIACFLTSPLGLSGSLESTQIPE